MGRADRGRPRQAHVLRAALGAQAGGRPSPSSARPCTGCRSSSSAGCSSRASIRSTPASCSSGTRSSRGTSPTRRCGARLYDFDRANSGCAPSWRSSRSAPDAATSCSTMRRSSTSTTGASRRSVASTRDFEGWWRKAKVDSPELLTMTAREPRRRRDAPTLDHDAFPSTWQQGDQSLDLSYRFEPGSEDDGVTVAVPLPLLAGLKPDGFDWQVPGLREELVTALIRSLPKSIRRHVVPAADWARTPAGRGRGRRGLACRIPRPPDHRKDVHAGHRRRLRPRPGSRPPSRDLRRDG